MLGNGEPSSGAGANLSEIRLLDLQALLGAQGLAALSAVLTSEDETGTALVPDADLLDILGDAGISPEAPISDNAPLSNTLGNAGVSTEDVMGATVFGDIVTVYLDRPIA